ncbi:MAG: Holliday junction branch migration protein RuvA [bacterium]|nr:Holliday junction branch migration protein RuvA [bacterium]
MIGSLTGRVLHRDVRYILLDVGGVGYKVFATTDTLEKCRPGTHNITLWTHLAVREDALDLYGFLDEESRHFFELLISISGIGPRTALSVLSVAPIKTLRNAISSGETSHLTKVSGIGKKIADKIVLELKDKLGAYENLDPLHAREEVDAVEALKALGYSLEEARDALKKINNDITGTGEKVKQALKILGTQK